MGTDRWEWGRTLSDPDSSAVGGFIRMRGLTRRIPVARSTILDWVRQGTFPRPVKLSDHVTAWSVDAVRQWESEKLGLVSAEATQ